jgi:hypothetical protein
MEEVAVEVEVEVEVTGSMWKDELAGAGKIADFLAID